MGSSKSWFAAICLVWCCSLFPPSEAQTVSTDPNQIAFYLYPNPNNFQDADTLVHNDPDSIRNSRFVVGKNLILLIHGFAQNYTLEFPQVVKDAYLRKGFAASSNIIAVDWGKLATPIPVAFVPWSEIILAQNLSSALTTVGYPLAENNTDVTARRVGDFLEFLVHNGFLANVQNTHIIGMSMGAHVAGVVGQEIQTDLGQTVARITGLDPAGPEYQALPATSRLDKTDAVYVDVVHTNMGEFGYLGALGHADYYVNGGGPLQPGCSLPTDVAAAFCAHGKAIYYYAASISNPSLKGCKCLVGGTGAFCFGISQCTAFGEYSPASASGCYCVTLTTNP